MRNVVLIRTSTYAHTHTHTDLHTHTHLHTKPGWVIRAAFALGNWWKIRVWRGAKRVENFNWFHTASLCNLCPHPPPLFPYCHGHASGNYCSTFVTCYQWIYQFKFDFVMRKSTRDAHVALHLSLSRVSLYPPLTPSLSCLSLSIAMTNLQQPP